MNYSLSLSLGGGSLTLDPDARAYIAAVEAADGQALEPAIRTAYDAFIRGCKADGIWDAIKASCILSGARSLSGALVPLKGSAPTNNNFVSNDYVRTTGLVGDGSTKYLDTNRLATADPQDNFHISVYVTTAQSSGVVGNYIGNGSAVAASGDALIGRSGLSPANLFVRGRADFTNNYVDRGASTGTIALSRNSSANFTTRAAGTEQISTQASSAPSAVNLNLYRLPDGTRYSTARLAYYSIGESLNLAALDARVTTLQADITAALP